jgi:hypothetical protein
MDFFIASVQLAGLSEGCYAARQPVCARVFIDFDQDCPVGPLSIFLARTFPTPRFRNIEYEETTRLKGAVNTTKKPADLTHAVALVEQIVQTFAKRCDRVAPREFDLEKRPYFEFAPGTRLRAIATIAGEMSTPRTS